MKNEGILGMITEFVDQLFINESGVETQPNPQYYQDYPGYQLQTQTFPTPTDQSRYGDISLFLWDTLKQKFDTVLLVKILFYLVLFKKVVFVIAIIFILIFLPSLKVIGTRDFGEDQGDFMSAGIGEWPNNSVQKLILEVSEKLNEIWKDRFGYEFEDGGNFTANLTTKIPPTAGNDFTGIQSHNTADSSNSSWNQYLDNEIYLKYQWFSLPWANIYPIKSTSPKSLKFQLQHLKSWIETLINI